MKQVQLVIMRGQSYRVTSDNEFSLSTRRYKEAKKIAQHLRALAIPAEDLLWLPEPTVLTRNPM